LLWCLFCASGAAALIYEVVWFQLIQLVIGSSGISLGVLLGTFMGGMCVGSLALARFISADWPPLGVYSALEFGIGFCGFGLLFLLPYAARGYVVWGAGLPGLFGRVLLCGLALLPPTVLMGATLPSVSRWLDNTPVGVSSLGFLYAGNIVGAVVGCLAAGFYLLRVHDMATTTYVAITLNVWVGTTALYLSGTSQKSDLPAKIDVPANAPRSGGIVHLVMALSGFCALSAEVVWTRLLSLMLGATVYAFSIILAVFLGGLALGSWAGAGLARTMKNPAVGLARCQLLLALAIAWAAVMLSESLPYWPIQPSLSHSVWLGLQLDLVRCAWAILPATCLFGASFPLALAAAVPATKDQARYVGRLYAANTFGAVLGALASSLLLLPWLGSQDLQRLLICIAAFSGGLVLLRSCSFSKEQTSEGLGVINLRNELASSPRPSPPQEERGNQPGGIEKLSTIRPLPLQRGEGRGEGALFRFDRRLIAWTLAALAGAAALIWTVPRLPWGLVAYGRYLPAKTDLGKALFVGEGVNASVAVTELSTGVRNFHISGKIEASTDPHDMRLQRMLGHIPGLLHPQPRSALVVGCGAGVTAGSFVTYPQVQQIVICEIEPLIPGVVAQYFGLENYDVLRDPRSRLIYDDARHYILTTHEKFDIITSDPIHPWVKGAATLYTKEYFELCKEHLNRGGLVTQWVPLYESNLAVVQSEIATFFEVFPNGTIWSNDDDGEGYDVVLLGCLDPQTIDLQAVQERFERKDYHAVMQSLREVGLKSTYSLFSTYAGQAADLKPWLRKAQINRDQNLRLQYLAGLGLNFNEQDLIYSDLLFYRRFPEELFTGSNVWKQALKSAIEKSSAKK
jgi:spermidine synthase